MTIKAANTSAKAHAIREAHRFDVKTAAATATVVRRKPLRRAVGGAGTRMEEEGSCANQWIVTASAAIKRLSMRPRKIPRPLHTAPSTSDANPNGTITPVSGTAGMFA